MLPLIDLVMKDLKLHIDIVVADLGYIDQKIKKEAREKYNTIIVTKAKKNMIVPSGFDTDGSPMCSEGQRLIWIEYLKENHQHIYKAPLNGEVCKFCGYQGRCCKEFIINANISETFIGSIPLHTELSKKLLRWIRPVVEQGNEEDKHRFGIESFFINSLELAKIISHLSDTCKIITLLAEAKTHSGKIFKRVYHEQQTQLELF